MYSLDINFLNDRSERASEAGLGLQSRLVQDSPRPLYIGVAVGIFFPVLVAASWLLLQHQNTELRARQVQLDSQLAELQALDQQLANINTQVQGIEAEVQALATVFDQIKPWSAMLQSIRDNVPVGVQVLDIEQQEQTIANQPAPAADQPAAAPPPPPPPIIQITGYARSFNDVNDFLLTLQRSPFLDSAGTRLVTAQLTDDPRPIEFTDQQGGGALEVQMPQVVSYTIQSPVTELTASELLADLESTLAVGLTARIQALRDRGVL